jgi:REP element-mobilizing transposase RayT
MWNARVEFLENSYYHIFNTSFTNEELFHNDEEYNKFYELIIKYLALYPSIKLVSYCLVPHHFHIVIKNIETGYNLSEFMRKIQVSYATWYRKRYPSEFKHPVFLWRFQSLRITDKDFLYKTLSFVNYLPLKYELCEEIWEYLYTSYHKLSKSSSQPYLNEIFTSFDELENKLKKKND